MTSTNKFRTYALTGAVAGITATGAWYGAGLNIRREVQQQQATIRKATTAEKLDQLARTRDRLVRQRDDLQAKIVRLTSSCDPAATQQDGGPSSQQNQQQQHAAASIFRPER